MPEDVLHAIQLIDSFPMLARAGILAVSVIIEYIFPIFPGDTVVIAAGFFSVHGKFLLWEIIGALIIGTFFGIWLTYYLGRLIAQKKITSEKITKFIPSQEIKKINLWYQKWGYSLLLINRFFPGIRSLFFVAAGMSKMPFIPVLISGMISALLFNGGLLVLGYSIGYNFESINTMWHRYTAVSSIIIGTVVAVFLAYFFHRKHKS